MEYLHWNEETIAPDASAEAVAAMYARGFVFTRKGKGVMQETRSARIDLSKFALSSENRRILKKTDGLELIGYELPYAKYDFPIAKLAKDFYDTKFGEGIMSAQKIKEMMTDPAKSNFNCLFTYAFGGATVGYTICYTSDLIHHYSYPFYDLEKSPKDMGLGMMIRGIEMSKRFNHRYFYLGSLQRPSDTYKLQFEGLEWWDGGPDGSGKWRSDTAALKEILK